MIYHTSFAARYPDRVAAVLAELVEGVPLRAPSPPFPHGSWFVTLGDGQGSLIEVIPGDFVFDPDTPLGVVERPTSSERHAMHVLIGTPRPHSEIVAIAQREGWRAQEVETGLFAIVKVWVEDRFLVEFMDAASAARYATAFGGTDRQGLDAHMRSFEAELGPKLLAKVSRDTLRAALGEPAF